MLSKTDYLTYMHKHTQTNIHFSELSSSVNFRMMLPKTDSLTYTHTQTHIHFSKLCDIERRYRRDVKESVFGSIVRKFTEDDYTWSLPSRPIKIIYGQKTHCEVPEKVGWAGGHIFFLSIIDLYNP